MEIAATALPGLGAAPPAAAMNEGNGAFAAALGAVGTQAPATEGLTAVAANGGVEMAGASAPSEAGGSGDVLLVGPRVPPTSATMPSPASTLAVQAKPPRADGVTASSQPASLAEADPVVVLPGAKDGQAPASPVAAELALSEAKDEQMPLGKQAEQDPDPPALVAGAVIPPAPVNDPHRVQATAPAPKMETQATKTDAGKSPEMARGIDRPARAAALDPNKGAVSDETSKPTGEPFARMVSNAPPERSQPQANAVPATPAAPQVPSQHVQVPPQPGVNPHTVPVEGHPAIPFRSDKVARDMGLEIARHVSAGGDELVIRLDPAELGRINIRMSVNEHGHLRAVVAADAPAVLDAIRGDIPELSRVLEQAGVRTDSHSFHFDRGNGGNPGGQWQQRYQQQSATGSHGEPGGPAMAGDEPAYRPMATNGRINMMA